jgi:branched-chain amino acid transport system substrate-binding protein
MRRSAHAFPILLATVALTAAACSSDSSPTASTPAGSPPDASATGPDTEPGDAVDPGDAGDPGDTVAIGSVASLTGPIAFPDGSRVLQLWVDDVNARGGIGGRDVTLVVEDGQIDPARTAAAAQKLVNDDQVVAVVGSTSVLDCAVNGNLYTAEGVPWVSGGLDAACMTSPQLFPTSATGSANTVAAVRYLLDQGHTAIALVGLDSALTAQISAEVTAAVEADGRGAVVLDRLLAIPPTGQDVSSAVLQARDAGADAVFFTGDGQTVALALAAGEQNAFGPDTVTWMLPPGLYDEENLPLWGESANGVLIAVGGLLVEDDTEFTQRLDELLAGEDLDPLAASASLASALVFEAALARLEGEPTRESLSAALAGLADQPSYLTPVTLDFTTPPTPESPREVPAAIRVVEVADGEFRPVTPDWIISD